MFSIVSSHHHGRPLTDHHGPTHPVPLRGQLHGRLRGQPLLGGPLHGQRPGHHIKVI